jgi:hypothetical protein
MAIQSVTQGRHYADHPSDRPNTSIERYEPKRLGLADRSAGARAPDARGFNVLHGAYHDHRVNSHA